MDDFLLHGFIKSARFDAQRAVGRLLVWHGQFRCFSQSGNVVPLRNKLAAEHNLLVELDVVITQFLPDRRDVSPPPEQLAAHRAAVDARRSPLTSEVAPAKGQGLLKKRDDLWESTYHRVRDFVGHEQWQC